MLLAYGGEDRRVPFKHGEAFRDALKRHGHTDHEWLFYGDEGHGWRKLDTQRDFWSRVERFLDRHIGAGRSTANAAE